MTNLKRNGLFCNHVASFFHNVLKLTCIDSNTIHGKADNINDDISWRLNKEYVWYDHSTKVIKIQTEVVVKIKKLKATASMGIKIR